MRETIRAYIKLLKLDRKKRQRLISLICALSFLVAGGVFWNLRIIGITLSRGALPDPNADVETRTEWEATLPNPAVMTGQWGADLVSVAYSQLGYKESKNNFIVDKTTGEKKGWTRYGAWDENSYADWSSLFVSFCINYAGIPLDAVPESPFAERDPNTLLSALNASEFYKSPDYIPVPGDLIFLDKNGDGAADAMGVVTEFDGEQPPARFPSETIGENPEISFGDFGITGESLGVAPAEPAEPNAGEFKNEESAVGLSAAISPDEEAPASETPEQPAEPEAPEQPAEPETPEQPAEPEAPEQPTSEAPEQPAEPETPEQPAPETPEQPTPEAPEQPAEPEAPEQPASEAPEQPAPEQPAPENGVHAIEGDSENEVRETFYDHSDAAILGYMSMGAVYTDYTGLEPYRSGGDFSALSGSVDDEGIITGVEKITVKLNQNGVTSESVTVTIASTDSGALPTPTTAALTGTQTHTFTDLNPAKHYKITEEPITGHNIASSGYPWRELLDEWKPVDEFKLNHCYAFIMRTVSGSYYYYYALDDQSYENAIGDVVPQLTKKAVTVDSNSYPTNLSDTSQWFARFVYDVNGTSLVDADLGSYAIFANASTYQFSQFNGSNFTVVSPNSLDSTFVMSGSWSTSNPYNGSLFSNAYAGGPRYMTEDFSYTTAVNSSAYIGLFERTQYDAMNVVLTVNADENTRLEPENYNFEHYKQIDWLGGGVNNDTNVDGINDYRLYLDVAAKTQPIDLLIIVDQSGSMEEKDIDAAGVKTRMDYVMEFLNGPNSDGTGFVDQFLSSNTRNQLSIISFSVADYENLTPLYMNDVTDRRDWGDTEHTIPSITPTNATDYCSALYYAEDKLAEVAAYDHDKRVLFLSDGEPTVSQSGKDATEYTFNFGSQGYTLQNGRETMAAIEHFVNAYPDVPVTSVAFHGPAAAFDDSFLGALAEQSHGSFYNAVTPEALSESINASVFPKNMAITDKLSQWVDFHSTKDLLVTMKPEGSDNPQPLYQNGVLTTLGTGILDNANPVTVDSSERTVALNCKPDYLLPAGTVFTISFNVTLTLDAKNYYLNNGNSYPDEGDPNTDYPGNHTSENTNGFFSNDGNALLTYTVGGMNYIEEYYRPVVQYKTDASSGGESGTHEMSKTIDFLGEKDSDGNFVDHNDDTDLLGDEFYRIYLNWSGALDKAYDLVLVIDTSSSMLDTLTGLSPSDYGYSTADSRKALVEKVLNGSGDDPGLIKKFLGSNPNNRLSIVTFNGVPWESDELTSRITWEEVTTLKKGEVYRFVDATTFNQAACLANIDDHLTTNTPDTKHVMLASDEYDTRQRWYAMDGFTDGSVSLSDLAFGYFDTYGDDQANVHWKFENGHLHDLSKNRYIAYSGNSGAITYTDYASSAATFKAYKRSNTYSYNLDAHYSGTDPVLDLPLGRYWGHDDSPFTLPVRSDDHGRGTNYLAGLLKAAELLDASRSPNKMMIFISDGIPTYYNYDSVFEHGAGKVRAGTGHEGVYNSTDGGWLNTDGAVWYTKLAANGWLFTEYDDVLRRSLLVNGEANLSDDTLTAIRSINSELQYDDDGNLMIDPQYGAGSNIPLHVPALHATNAAQLETFLNQLLFPYGVKIEDTLSEYVDMHDLASVKVTRTDTSVEPPTTVTIWEGANRENYNGTADNQGQIASVTYNTATKKLTVQFASDFIADPRYTYTVSFDVQVTQTAINEWNANIDGGNPAGAYGGVTGELGTDYGENQTSSGKPGFFANAVATVTTTENGVESVETFPKPVVQVSDKSRYEHHKRIDFLGELRDPENPYDETSNPYAVNNGDTDLVGKDFYRLYLDMSARPVQGAYLMILVDRSTSMQDVDVITDEGTISRIAAVNQVLGTTDKNYGAGLIKDFLQAHSGNRVSIISFGGVDRYNSFTDDAETVVGWSDATNFGSNLSASANGVWAAPKQPTEETQGTNYCAGLKMAAELWGDNVPASAPKVMVIISDGEPTFYLNYDAESTRYGNGQTPCHAQSKLYFANFHAANPGVHVEAVGFGQNFATETLDYMAQNADSSSSARALTADNTAELTAALRSQIFPSHVEIKDVLSRYVRCYTEDADFKVTRTDTTVINPTPDQPATVTIYENGAPVTGVGYMTSVDGTLRPIVMSFEYIIDNDYAADPDTALSTGVVTVKFDPEFVVEPQYVYTISFNVALTQKAYDTYDNNNINYLHKGDDDTDYPDNATSSDKWGFRSNNEATHIIYGVGNDVNLIESYNHPVVQVQGGEALKPEQQTGELPVKKEWNDAGHENLRTPVTLRLYAYGTINGVEYSHSEEADNRFFTGRQVVLDGSEPTLWTYTFEGIPLYQTDRNGDLILDDEDNPVPLDYFIVEDPVPDNYTASYGAHPEFSVAFLPGDSSAETNALNPNALGGNVSAAATYYYEKVTTASSLTAGETYLITYETGGKVYAVQTAYKTSTATNCPALTEITPVPAPAHGANAYTIADLGTNTALFTSGGDASSGWTFHCSKGYLAISIYPQYNETVSTNGNEQWEYDMTTKFLKKKGSSYPYLSVKFTSAGTIPNYIDSTDNTSGDPAFPFTFYKRVESSTPPPPPPPPPAGGTEIGYYFETQADVDLWTIIDHDKDDHNWTWWNGGGDKVPEGQGCMTSESYVNYVGPLTPDNWLISPAVTGGGSVSFQYIGQDASDYTENFGVYAVPANTQLSSTTPVSDLGTELGYFTSSDSVQTGTVSLASFANQQIKLVFRHYNTTNQFRLNLDAVVVTVPDTPPAPETGALTITLTAGDDTTSVSNRGFTISNGSGYSRTVTTGDDGTVTVSGLEEGSYMITPTPVTGCTYNPISSPATVTAGQTTPVSFTITTPSAASPGNFSEAVVTNTLNLQTLKFVKRASPENNSAPANSGDPLKDAVFELYRTDAAFSQPALDSDGLPRTSPPLETFVGSYTSAATGIVEFSDLTCGNYLLYERTVPEGYKRAGGQPWHVVITNSGVTVTDAAGNPAPPDPSNNNLPIIFNASLGYALPETGGSGILPYTLCGVMLMLLPLMYLAYDRGRKRKGGIKKGASSR